MKKLDDMRHIGAVICLGSGAWALAKGIGMGDWRRAVRGFAFIVIGFVVAYLHRRESNSISG